MLKVAIYLIAIFATIAVATTVALEIEKAWDTKQDIKIITGTVKTIRYTYQISNVLYLDSITITWEDDTTLTITTAVKEANSIFAKGGRYILYLSKQKDGTFGIVEVFIRVYKTENEQERCNDRKLRSLQEGKPS